MDRVQQRTPEAYGFTGTGDVIVSDPVAARAVSVVARHEVARRWLVDGDGPAWTFVPP